MPDRLTGPSILALVGRQQTGPDLWRVLQPITALEKLNYPAGWDFKDADLLGLVASVAEAILLPRMEWPPEYRRVAEAWFQKNKDDGKTTIYDADDDIFTAAETQRRVELGWMEGRTYEQLEASRFERIWAMQQCDGVTVSTQRLATIVRSFTTKPVIVVPNSIDLVWFRGVVKATRRQIPGLTIGWAGGRRHDRDVEMMAEAWGRIAQWHKSVRFVVQGHVPPVILENVDRDRLAILPWMRLEDYPYGLRQVDIGCCAVSPTPFNRAKSPIKAYEYAAAGAAVIASPTLYSGVIDNGFSGWIADSVGEWEDALSQLIESHALRKMMNKRLLKVVEKKYSLAVNLHRWPDAWSQIAESRSRIIQVRNVPA
jgi:glycosyltransferase involved in cell wall biosynthesis